jgi:rSAM/selenodomain-associated transferase 2
MEIKPEISIIIPVLNEEKVITGLINELKKRSGESEIEIIVADGGSDDNTRQLATESGAKVIICKRKGRARQMNEGAEYASGNVLYFLHADTLPPLKFPNHISKYIRDGVDAGCYRLQFDDDHLLLRAFAWFTRFDLNWFRFGDQSLFIKREVYEEIGGFDERLIVMEDQEIVKRIRLRHKFQLMDDHVITSARKYKANGVLRLQLIFTLIFLLYYVGVKQDVLISIYKDFIDL